MLKVKPEALAARQEILENKKESLNPPNIQLVRKNFVATLREKGLFIGKHPVFAYDFYSYKQMLLMVDLPDKVFVIGEIPPRR